MKSTAAYAGLLASYTERTDRSIQAIEGNDLLRRKSVKRRFIHQLVILKMLCRALKNDYVSGFYDQDGYDQLRLMAGRFVLGILYDIDNARIKLTENEYRSLFNITAEEWDKCYPLRKKPEGVLDAVFINNLSDEIMFEFMADALLVALKSESKAWHQARNFFNYEMGF